MRRTYGISTQHVYESRAVQARENTSRWPTSIPTLSWVKAPAAHSELVRDFQRLSVYMTERLPCIGKRIEKLVWRVLGSKQVNHVSYFWITPNGSILSCQKFKICELRPLGDTRHQTVSLGLCYANKRTYSRSSQGTRLEVQPGWILKLGTSIR